MSDIPRTDRTSLGKLMKSLNAGEEFSAYSRVVIYAGTTDDGEDIIYEAGTDTGSTLEIENEWGSQQMAENILAQIRGWQYQPYEATGAYLDPITEIGDGVTANDIYSGVYNRSISFEKTMIASISAPSEEETVHEYGYDTSTDRKFERTFAAQRAAISLNEKEIIAEVNRATEAEGALSASLKLEADSIKANVSSKLSTSSKDSEDFGWELTATNWRLYANNKTVLNANKDGLEVKGNITATSGYIGSGSNGFTITATSMYNRIESMDSENTRGVYLGTDGIRLGRYFSVTEDGILTAKSGYIGSGNYTFSIAGSDARSAIYSGINSMDSEATSGIYLGTDGIRMGSKFSVTRLGDLTAKSGFIGNGDKGFTISSNAIYNGISLYGDPEVDDGESTGVYIGTNGIRLGSNFRVSSTGAITATQGTFSGTIKCDKLMVSNGEGGYKSIDVSTVASGISGGNSYSGRSGTINSAVNGYNSAIVNGTGTYPSHFTTGTLHAKSGVQVGGALNASSIVTPKLTIGSTQLGFKTININGTYYYVCVGL